MKLTFVFAWLVIIVSLIPFYYLYVWIGRQLNPKKSMQRFLIWILIVLLLISVYTFCLVLLFHTLFPNA
ncbi:MAG TPA: hypothetical protein PLG88_01145 [Chitinophagaceae bacterium]|nr:hypothetical protein [Chitinophagaceae bacterium]